MSEILATKNFYVYGTKDGCFRQGKLLHLVRIPRTYQSVKEGHNKIIAILFNQQTADCISLNLQEKALHVVQVYSVSLRL